MTEIYDALVVGAGPAGSRTAYKLAKRGHRVLVFERHPGVGEGVCCTGIVGRECLERFPVGRRAIAAEASSATLVSPSGKSLRVAKEIPQAYVVDRPSFDRALAEQAEEEGAEYLLSARVLGIGLVDHRVRAEVEYGGQICTFEGKVSIVSSGFGVSVAGRMGLGRVKDYVLGAQAEVDVRDVSEVEVYLGQSLAPGFFAWVVPTSSSRALVGLLSRRKPRANLRNLLCGLVDDGRVVSGDVKFSHGGIPLLPLARTYGERVVIVGDAAGQVKPTTGGGIYYGLLCADIAAETVHEALCEGDFSAKKLSQYEKRWRRVLSRELQIGYLVRRIYETLSDSQIEDLFRLVQDNGIHEHVLASPDFSFDWHADWIVKALANGRFRRAVWEMTRSKLSF